MEATLTATETKYLDNFEGKTPEEVREAIHEINMVRARTLGRLSALVAHTHKDLKYMTWHGIDSDFNPEETYISVTKLQEIISYMEISIKEVNEQYETIGGGKIVYA
jgi:hypothetical protein